MKRIAGEFFSHSSNAFLKLDSDSPANLLMISGPAYQHHVNGRAQVIIEDTPFSRKKKAPVSLATALAISVLPHPGGPNSKMPRGG